MKKNNNKGFTLVELIVVLVILAILAAILVPALLGYIDRAREKQYVLNAKSALTATQAELSSMYGEGVATIDATALTARAATVSATADTPAGSAFYIKIQAKSDDSKGAVKANHAHYTVKEAYYTEGDYILQFDGSSWKTVTEAPSGYTLVYSVASN